MNGDIQRLETKIDALDNKTEKILIQTTKTNGRGTQIEKDTTRNCQDIAEVKADNSHLWEKFNTSNANSARREGALTEWEKNVSEFKQEMNTLTKETARNFDSRVQKIEDAIMRKGLLTTVGSGGSSVAAILALKALGWL
jgi:chromosome segregation ATPase